MFWYLVEQVDIGYLGTMSPTISIPSGNSWKNIWLWHALALDQDPTKIAGISVDILWMWYIWMYLIGFCGAPVSFSRFFLCFFYVPITKCEFFIQFPPFSGQKPRPESRCPNPQRVRAGRRHHSLWPGVNHVSPDHWEFQFDRYPLVN